MDVASASGMYFNPLTKKIDPHTNSSPRSSCAPRRSVLTSELL
jgi:hypothetical protein